MPPGHGLFSPLEETTFLTFAIIISCLSVQSYLYAYASLYSIIILPILKLHMSGTMLSVFFSVMLFSLNIVCKIYPYCYMLM